MNERAREALVAAALSGVRQITGQFRDGSGGRCAVGVLGDATRADCQWDLKSWADMDSEELSRVVRANDQLGWDFLTIARKFGNDDAVHPTQETITHG